MASSFFLSPDNGPIAGEECPNIWNNGALGDKFLKFGMVLGIGTDFQNPSQTKWA